MGDLNSIKEQNKEIIKRIQAGEGLMFDNLVNESIFKISKSDTEGTYTTELPVNLIVIMLTTFYKIDYIID